MTTWRQAKRPSEASGEVLADYRGEGAHERFRLAELNIVQENVRRIVIEIAVEDDDDNGGEYPYLDSRFSDRE